MLLFASGLFAQTTSDIAVVEGQRGTMKIFDALGGFNEVYLSRNGQFFYGKFESTNGFIYDIKNEDLEVFDYGIIAVNDLDNYVASTFAVIEGQRYDFDMQGLAAQLGGGNFAIEEASADLRTLRAFCYITDAVAGMLFAMLSEEGLNVYNIANETEEFPIRDVAEKLVSLFPEKGLKVVFDIPETMSAGYSKMGRTKLCTKKIEKLGWKPGVSLEDGLRRTVESFAV